jgi:hypothetical protein
MGVDASYIYGYMAKKENVIWDTEYLKGKWNLEENLTGWLKEYTYGDLVNWLEEDEVDDWYDIAEIMGMSSAFAYDQEYLHFNHFDLIKKFPDRKIGEFESLVKEYAKQSGVKNYDVFKWNEFGFFD